MIGTAFLVIFAYLVGREAGKRNERKKTEELQQESTSQLVQKMAATKEPRKKDVKKDAIAIMMEFIRHSSLFNDFKLVSVENGIVIYQYLENDYLFTVIRDEEDDEIELKISKNKTELLHYAYDKYCSEFDKQEMHRSLIENYTSSEANEIIHRYMRHVVHSSRWESFPEGFVLKDDIQRISPVYTEKDIHEKQTEETKKQANSVSNEPSILDSVHSLQKMVFNSTDSLDPTLVSIFHRILRNTQDCLLHIDRLDEEKKHSVKHLLQKDLGNILTSYLELSEESKNEKLPETIDALKKIDTGVKEILELFEKQNIREHEQHVRVVKQRDY